MTEPIVVDVTADDIRRGRHASCTRCPVALAVSRACGCAVVVGPVFVIGPCGSWAVLPKRAAAWVEKFDQRLSVKPFRFRLPGKLRGDAP